MTNQYSPNIRNHYMRGLHMLVISANLGLCSQIIWPNTRKASRKRLIICVINVIIVIIIHISWPDTINQFMRQLDMVVISVITILIGQVFWSNTRKTKHNGIKYAICYTGLKYNKVFPLNWIALKDIQLSITWQDSQRHSEF